MKAAVVRAFGEPPVFEQCPDPEPGPGPVRGRVEASGLCHTDIHAARGDWPVRPGRPFVPGHEGVGLVAALGDAVTHLTPGQRGAVPWPGRTCGRREHCLSGGETPRERRIKHRIRVRRRLRREDARLGRRGPAGAPRDRAAGRGPLTCAGATTYKALKAAGVRAGQSAAAPGVGGPGHPAVRCARIGGARPDRLRPRRGRVTAVVVRPSAPLTGTVDRAGTVLRCLPLTRPARRRHPLPVTRAARPADVLPDALLAAVAR